MWNSIFLKEEHLHWIEDHPEWFVNVITRPEGELFDPNTDWIPVRVGDLPQYLATNARLNIWRSWDVFSKQRNKLRYIGLLPIIIDIDDEEQNLFNAHRLTTACLQYIQSQTWGREENLRVIFSGKKGFHIEIKPTEPVDAQELRQDLILGAARILGCEENLNGWNVFFGSTALDRFHDFIRLTSPSSTLL